MKIVVTGGFGYLGARLSAFLSKIGHEVIIVSSSNRSLEERIQITPSKVIVGDISEVDIIEVVANEKPDAIIHLVSLDHFDSEKDPNFVAKINVLPTWSLLDACIKKGLKKFIFFSTIHTYGINQNGYINETQKTTPTNAYGLTHALSEEIVNYYNRKDEVNCLNIRLSNSYGEPIIKNKNCWTLVVNDLTKSAFKNKKIILKSDGSAIRDFIHYSDICDGISKLLDKENFNENTLHFSSSKSISILDVASKIKYIYIKRYKSDLPIYINKTEIWNKSVVENNTKNSISNELSKTMGLDFNTTLEKGIEGLFNYLEKENAKS